MITYLTAFIFYTLAMVGILLLGFVVYKKFNFPTKLNANGLIKIVDSCAIGAKKNLLVVKIGNERFLIASGLEHTTFLAKLDSNSSKQTETTEQNTNVEQIRKNIEPLSHHNVESKIQPRQVVTSKPQQEKDVYDFLYSQSKKLEEERLSSFNNKISQEISQDDNKNILKELYAKQPTQQVQDSINSRKQLMQELLNEIHQTKLKTGSRM